MNSTRVIVADVTSPPSDVLWGLSQGYTIIPTSGQKGGHLGEGPPLPFLRADIFSLETILPGKNLRFK